MMDNLAQNIDIRPLLPADREWVREKMIAEWGAENMIIHGENLRPAELPGLAAEIDGQAVGLLTYILRGEACEIVTLNAWRVGLGIGQALIEAARQTAVQAGCRRLWLVTTNDNTSALRFYQKCGFVLCALRVDAVALSRKIKPEIPLTGEAGIPIRDELELEMLL